MQTEWKLVGCADILNLCEFNEMHINIYINFIKFNLFLYYILHAQCMNVIKLLINLLAE